MPYQLAHLGYIYFKAISTTLVHWFFSNLQIKEKIEQQIFFFLQFGKGFHEQHIVLVLLETVLYGNNDVLNIVQTRRETLDRVEQRLLTSNKKRTGRDINKLRVARLDTLLTDSFV